MTEIITLVLSAIGELAKIAFEAAQNVRAAETELLAKLRVTLASAAATVDARLAVLEVARREADAKIEASAPNVLDPSIQSEQ